jgi:hypothetical protein
MCDAGTPWFESDIGAHAAWNAMQSRAPLPAPAEVDDDMRQALQVIRSEADNIRTRLGMLHVGDTDVTESQAAIDRAVARIDVDLRALTTALAARPGWEHGLMPVQPSNLPKEP